MDKLKANFHNIIDNNWFKLPDNDGKEHEQMVKKNKYVFIGVGTILIIFLFYLILILSTNFTKLDDFEDYIDEYKEKGYSTKFNEINLGIKIKPSYNSENNILYMRHSTNVSINK